MNLVQAIQRSLRSSALLVHAATARWLGAGMVAPISGSALAIL
jgi:hypothetical protein